MDERTAIGVTIDDLKASLAILEGQEAAIREQIREKRELIRYWSTRLEATAESGRKRRLKKGEPLKIVRRVLSENPAGLSITEVADKGGIQWSTARTALDKNPDVFVERNSAWFLRTEGGLSAVK